MKTLRLTVDKGAVWEEVAKTTAYTGAKKFDADNTAYGRILLTDADKEIWQRFWEEAGATANEGLRDMIVCSGDLSGDYTVELEVSAAYDNALDNSVRKALQGFFVYTIVAKWYQLCNKEQSAEYYTMSDEMMKEALRILYTRRRPRLPRTDKKG